MPNRSQVMRVIVILAIIAALVIGVSMLRGNKATVPDVPKP